MADLAIIRGRLLEGLLERSPGPLVERMERGLKELAAGRVEVPRRILIPEGGGGATLVMSAADADFVAVKYIAVRPGNAGRGIPTSPSAIMLLERSTGVPLALMDGSSLTAYRTAAVSAVAAKYLSMKGVAAVGFLGAGRQARAHALTISAVLRPREAYVYDVSMPAALGLAERLLGLGVAARALGSEDEVAARSDVIVAATTSRSPVVRGRALKEGALVISIGWVDANSLEVDEELVGRSALVVVDSQAALEEAGDLRLPLLSGALSGDKVRLLSDVVAGSSPGRASDRDVVLYKGVGSAYEDLFAAELAYELSKGRGDVQLLEL